MLSPFEMAQLGKERQQEFIKAAELTRRVKNSEDIRYEDLPVQQKAPFFQLPNPFSFFSKPRKLRRASQS
ncbi:MAG: hypothetical protein KC546_16840 [Anaerolineae bacterium]|nr:hypothetical protein [Anaerolineae bacterium]MCA9890049.1 hypothetical protein [Anaerolineae bacterium]MCB9460299.1 hypothetical protein [Anaerolineaceae bacterium]